MKNGLYSVHIQMGDGVKGRASGVIVLRDGRIYGGDPYFWSVGSYTFKESACKEGTWKGDLVTNQHTPYRDPTARPVYGGREVTTGFSGTWWDDTSEVFGTSRWWAHGASVFARHCAGWPNKKRHDEDDFVAGFVGIGDVEFCTHSPVQSGEIGRFGSGITFATALRLPAG